MNTKPVPGIRLTEKQLTRFILAEAIKKFRGLAVGYGKVIKIVISSRGGDTEGALILADLINRAKIADKEIHGFGYGEISSAAALILIACTRRRVKRSSRLMLHPVIVNYPVSRLIGGNRLPKRVIKKGLMLQRKVDVLLELRTGLSAESIEAAARHKVLFTDEQALSCGMIDEIVD